MSNTTLPDYLTVNTELQSAALSVTPAELHGLLVGMLSGGLSVAEKSWQPLIVDYTNDGVDWPSKALTVAETVLLFSQKELANSTFDFSLLLPTDNETDLLEQAEAVSQWVNHFISGLGLVKLSLLNISAETREAIGDLEEISKLGIDEEDDMQEQADLLEQVIEHIKVCVLTIYAEFGIKPDKEAKKPTLH